MTFYKSAHRVQNQVNHLLSWQDARLTLKALILSVMIFTLAWIVGDSLFCMIAFNSYMLLPIIEKKKPKLYEKIFTSLNNKVDLIIKTVPYITRIERQKKASIE